MILEAIALLAGTVFGSYTTYLLMHFHYRKQLRVPHGTGRHRKNILYGPSGAGYWNDS